MSGHGIVPDVINSSSESDTEGSHKRRSRRSRQQRSSSFRDRTRQHLCGKRRSPSLQRMSSSRERLSRRSRESKNKRDSGRLETSISEECRSVARRIIEVSVELVKRADPGEIRRILSLRRMSSSRERSIRSSRESKNKRDSGRLETSISEECRSVARRIIEISVEIANRSDQGEIRKRSRTPSPEERRRVRARSKSSSRVARASMPSTRGNIRRRRKRRTSDSKLDPPADACFQCWSKGHNWIKCPFPEKWKFCVNCGRKINSMDQSDQCTRCGKVGRNRELLRGRKSNVSSSRRRLRFRDRDMSVHSIPEATGLEKSSRAKFGSVNGRLGRRDEDGGRYDEDTLQQIGRYLDRLPKEQRAAERALIMRELYGSNSGPKNSH